MKFSKRIIQIEEQALAVIEQLSAQSAQEGLETGGFLIGKRTDDGYRILHATHPGPKADRTSRFVEPDYGDNKRQIAPLKKDDPSLELVGGWHLHPIHGLSPGDKATLRSVSKEYPGFLSLVVCGFHKRIIRVFSIEDGRIREHQWKTFSIEEPVIDYSRTNEIVPSSKLAKKTAWISGSGSGGNEVALLLGYAGVGRFILADHEKLEKANLVRHIGRFYQLGQYKADIVADQLRLINPDVRVDVITRKVDDITITEFKRRMKRAHVLLDCTGSPEANRFHNDLSVELRKPITFGGVFEKASGGFAFQSIPYQKNNPCLNCIHQHTTQTQIDSNDHANETAKRYGWSEEELNAQQGLFIDIKPVAILQAKMALRLLLRGTKHNMPKMPGNLAVWNADTMSTRWADVRQRHDCAVCNSDGWLKARRKALLSVQGSQTAE